MSLQGKVSYDSLQSAHTYRIHNLHSMIIKYLTSKAFVVSILTPTTEKAELKRLIVKNSQVAYLLADSSKFYKQAVTRINSMSDYTGVITTKKFSKEELKRPAKKNINVIEV